MGNGAIRSLPCSSVASFFSMLTPTRTAAVLALALVACERKDDGTMRLIDGDEPLPATRVEEPPVAINPVSPVRYPQALLDQGIEGQVLLRLYVDSSGNVIPDS